MEGFRERREEGKGGRMDLEEDEVGWLGRKQRRERVPDPGGRIYIQCKRAAEATLLDGVRRVDRVAGRARSDGLAGDRRPCLAIDGRRDIQRRSS